ncbi:MAG: helix-turn-helix domain-containing protein [Achromobacter sp.]|uniref:helix-turn-helix domain-containing protein n=1 Tax=Achromobacter sp. TaxID=134375 RepID=UPI003D042EC3
MRELGTFARSSETSSKGDHIGILKAGRIGTPIVKLSEIQYIAQMNWKSLIRDLMRQGWTQAQIAKEIGISQPTVAGILAGDQKDMKWQNGERLRSLHSIVCSAKAAPKPKK